MYLKFAKRSTLDHLLFERERILLLKCVHEKIDECVSEELPALCDIGSSLRKISAQYGRIYTRQRI